MREPEFTVDAAVATATPKAPERNQDRALAVTVTSERAGAVAVVCDGVGAFEASGDVAALCVEHVGAHVGELGVADGVLSCAESAAAALTDISGGATTLLVVGAETYGRAYFTLVGNGAIFAIEPVDVRGGRANLRVAELALPHVTYAQGRPALRSFLPAPMRPVEESSGVLLPRPGRARVLLACSDGVSTDEDCPVGTTPSGQTWKHLRRPLWAVVDALAGAWVHLLAAPDRSQALGGVLQGCLDELVAAGAFDDDATVGAVLIGPAGEAPA